MFVSLYNLISHIHTSQYPVLSQDTLHPRNVCIPLQSDITHTDESVSSVLRKLAVVALLDVPVSPTSTTGLLMFTISSSSHVVRTVSTVGTRISLNVLSGSCTYWGITSTHGTHLSCLTSKKYSYKLGCALGISPEEEKLKYTTQRDKSAR